jgi:hypothetical protein
MAGILALICASLVVPQHAHSVLESTGCMNFLPAPPRDLSQSECCVAAGARGKAADEGFLGLDYSGLGRA